MQQGLYWACHFLLFILTTVVCMLSSVGSSVEYLIFSRKTNSLAWCLMNQMTNWNCPCPFVGIATKWRLLHAQNGCVNALQTPKRRTRPTICNSDGAVTVLAIKHVTGHLDKRDDTRVVIVMLQADVILNGGELISGCYFLVHSLIISAYTRLDQPACLLIRCRLALSITIFQTKLNSNLTRKKIQ